MNSPVTEQDLHAFVDGQLPPRRLQQVTEWLREHPHEADRVAAYQRLNQELQQAYPHPRDAWQRPLQARSPRWLSIAAAIALFTMAGGLGGWQLNEWSRQQAHPFSVDLTQRLVQPARVAHRVYTPEVLHPVEVRQDQQQHLVGWLSKRLGQRINAPDLNSQGFSLVGGRLLPSTDGPAAQFMYEDEAGQRLTLYVREANEAVAETRFHRYSADGISSFYWIDNGLGYALTGEISPERLMSSASQVYRQLSF